MGGGGRGGRLVTLASEFEDPNLPNLNPVATPTGGRNCRTRRKVQDDVGGLGFRVGSSFTAFSMCLSLLGAACPGAWHIIKRAYHP